jgi:hypothetical protein
MGRRLLSKEKIYIYPHCTVLSLADTPSVGLGLSPSGLDSASLSLHFQPAQHACAAVMWPNRRQLLRRAARNNASAFGW